MVLRLVRGTGGSNDARSGQSASGAGNERLTDFQREMILAEQHAENLRKRQRRNLLNEDFGPTVSIDANEEEDGLIEEDPLDMNNLNDIIEDTTTKADAAASDDVALFDEETDQQSLAPTSLVNKARVSKTRALHILEHPHCSKYLVGSLMRIWITPDAAPDSVSSQHPHLVNTHAIFKVERLVKTNEYVVYGDSVGNSCDHEIREFLGKTSYSILGRLMTDRRSDTLNKIGLNDVCSAPILQEEIKFGGEWLIRDLNQAATNLRNVSFPHGIFIMMQFTFTDEDVQLILERKLLKESVEQTEFQGGRSSLIAAIQRTSHEIELLTELVKNDTSKIDHLRALEARKAKMDEQLQTMKALTRNPLFIKTCPVLRANAEPSARGGAVRKTTQPTPMIMFNNIETQEIFPTEIRRRERKTVSEFSYEEQKELVIAYITVSISFTVICILLQNVDKCDPDQWLSPSDDVNAGNPGKPDQAGVISMKEYLNMA
ncbi:hypothetical protein, conserved [Babesia bigemina]|uniref:Plus3 domain-containing protein n=1 Tax=Babesia bigemina TaxID=5866 RepID=A0A061D7G6_BABBI|nr:hypothetical protein, conserved [Babesia bigemina]CDR96488.1 hypothetical protein, conserved [Babesia bigemina]|eukprot:XP_012768674.1 hypothetical protein, conserved [Babesia bigemina]